MEFTAQQKFMLSLVQKVGCLSMNEMNYIMYGIFRLNKGKVKMLTADFVAKGYMHTNKQFAYVADGKYGSSFATDLNADTIRAVATAIALCEDIEDMKTAYNPNLGADLIFSSEGTLFQISNIHAFDYSRVGYFQTEYDSKVSQFNVNSKADEENLSLIAPTNVFVFEAKADKEATFSRLQELKITMPHIIAFMKDEDIFGNFDVDLYEM